MPSSNLKARGLLPRKPSPSICRASPQKKSGNIYGNLLQVTSDHSTWVKIMIETEDAVVTSESLQQAETTPIIWRNGIGELIIELVWYVEHVITRTIRTLLREDPHDSGKFDQHRSTLWHKYYHRQYGRPLANKLMAKDQLRTQAATVPADLAILLQLLGNFAAKGEFKKNNVLRRIHQYTAQPQSREQLEKVSRWLGQMICSFQQAEHLPFMDSTAFVNKVDRCPELHNQSIAVTRLI